MNGRVGIVVSVLAIAVAACSGSSGPGGVSPSSGSGSGSVSSGLSPASLTIYAASSLRAALDTATRAYQSSHPGTTFTISTDSSSALETKIEQGAPADIFLSADTANPRKLVDRGLTSGPLVTFASNVLAIVVPRTNPGGIRTPADLAKPGVKVIAAGANVPITRYALRLVANLASQPGYPADFAAAYAANVVSNEDNVAAVVSKVELGEGDAGIVYATDAKAAGNVSTIAVPAAANVPAEYGGVVVGSSPNQRQAAAFLAWLAAPGGQAILGRFGFLPPS